MKPALGSAPLASSPPAPRPAPRSVVTWDLDPKAYCSDHEHATRTDFARRLAALTGGTFAGGYDAGQAYASVPYFVPSNTLTDPQRARDAGIHGIDDLFGGVVPHAFVATKAITHPVRGSDAPRPEGWSCRFATEVAGAALEGFACFSQAQAREAGRAMLEKHGVVRIKPVAATGGRGQVVVRDPQALDRCIDAMDEAGVAAHGVVLEENLDQPVTYSVGQVVVARTVVSYYGRQRLARDNTGEEVYGGSDLTLVRGDFETLLAATDLAPPLRQAIDQARRYHHAVGVCYPGFFASRVNYDVAQGMRSGSRDGAWRSGVLEQSWRVGGATGAEIAALEFFNGDPARERVHASTFEVYGAVRLPAQATVSYQGVDPQVGPLAKFSLIHTHAHSP